MAERHRSGVSKLQVGGGWVFGFVGGFGESDEFKRNLAKGLGNGLFAS